MEWITSLRKAISYMEDNLLEDVNANDVAEHVCISSFYLQKGFQLVTGYTISEYIKKRRLYLAALEMFSNDTKIIDLAFKYGYETPESFTKAFTRFHGVTPTGLKSDRTAIKTFLPLKINLSIQGGNEMDYVVEKMKGFKVIGFQKIFTYEESKNEIPKYWNQIYAEKIAPLCKKKGPETEEEETICNCQVGTYGVCICDCEDPSLFRYLIAGQYTQGEVPEGMTVYEFPEMEWIKFKCVGPIPGAIQSVNTKIFSEWLPNNEKYDMAMDANIEWYSPKGNSSDVDYESGIWLPVKKK